MGSLGSFSVPFKYGSRGSGSMDYINNDSDDSCRPVGHGEGSIGKVWASKVDAEMRREEDGIIVAYQENNKRKEEKGTQQKTGS